MIRGQLGNCSNRARSREIIKGFRSIYQRPISELTLYAKGSILCPPGLTLGITAVSNNRPLRDKSRSVSFFVCLKLHKSTEPGRNTLPTSKHKTQYNIISATSHLRYLETPRTQDLSVRRLVLSHAEAKPVVVDASRRSQGCSLKAKNPSI